MPKMTKDTRQEDCVDNSVNAQVSSGIELIIEALLIQIIKCQLYACPAPKVTKDITLHKGELFSHPILSLKKHTVVKTGFIRTHKESSITPSNQNGKTG